MAPVSDTARQDEENEWRFVAKECVLSSRNARVENMK